MSGGAVGAGWSERRTEYLRERVRRGGGEDDYVALVRALMEGYGMERVASLDEAYLLVTEAVKRFPRSTAVLEYRCSSSCRRPAMRRPTPHWPRWNVSTPHRTSCRSSGRSLPSRAASGSRTWMRPGGCSSNRSARRTPPSQSRPSHPSAASPTSRAATASRVLVPGGGCFDGWTRVVVVGLSATCSAGAATRA
jgi:hypothetical protein